MLQQGHPLIVDKDVLILLLLAGLGESLIVGVHDHLPHLVRKDCGANVEEIALVALAALGVGIGEIWGQFFSLQHLRIQLLDADLIILVDADEVDL